MMKKKLLFTQLLYGLTLVFYTALFFKEVSCSNQKTNDFNAISSKDQTPEQLSWDLICKQSQSAVCQIFCCSFSPNFVEPYLSLERSGGCRGSGFCITDDGFILTNYHVVDRAIAIYIQFPMLGKNRYKADYIGGCPDYDIALLKLSEEALSDIQGMGHNHLPYLKLGDSDSVSAGQKLAAIGYPLGHENIKISSGICSGREELDLDYIQTTIPINSGNSGGAVFNKTGDVIGVSSSKIVGVGVEGVAFVIPINNVLLLLGELMKSPVVRAPFWGIHYVAVSQETLDYFLSLQELSPEVVAYFARVKNVGVLATRIKKHSLFELAGLLPRDIMLEINGRPIDNYGYIKLEANLPALSLRSFLSRFEFESEIDVLYLREGMLRHAQVIVQQPPDLPIKEWVHWSQKLPKHIVFGGMVVTELSLNLLSEIAHGASAREAQSFGMLKYAKVKNRVHSRVCLSVCLPHSQAFKAFHRSKSSTDRVIKKINNREVSSINDVSEALIAGAHQKYIVIETEGGVVAALSLKDVLEEETALAEQYGYEVSEIVEEIKKQQEVVINKVDGQT